MGRLKGLMALVLADPRPVTQGFRFAMMYAIQAVACCAVLWVAFTLAHAPAYNWAMISAILVLQPQLRQALSVALTRIAANIVGASVGLLVGRFLGLGIAQMLGAVAVTAVICGLLRLDLGLRTACVAAVIVMSAHDGTIYYSGVERAVAVTVGCVTAVGLQLTVHAARERAIRLRLLHAGAEEAPGAAVLPDRGSHE